ncbi:MAG: hypothetical protein U0R44_04745, partial [Candidatus Micrarchaeia archaeon]
MSTAKNVFGVMVLMLLVGAVFAQGAVLGQENQKESQVVITPADDDGKVINISVIVFEPAVSTGGTNIRDVMAQITSDCHGNQTCILQRSAEATNASTSYRLNATPLMGAHFVVEYFNPQGNAFRGMWSTVPGCENIVADQPGTAYRPTSLGGTESYTYYYAQCDLSGIVGSTRTSVRATFVPQPEQSQIASSSAEYEYNNAHVSPASEFTQNINNFIRGVSESGGAGIGVGALPCVGVFLIMGLLLASMYFSGKSPISMLDITTPRLPSPKGVTAGGQILAPFGYTEMKRTTNQKMVAAAGALSATTRVLSSRMGQDGDTTRLRQMARSAQGDAADRAANIVGRERQVAEAVVVAGRAAGMRPAELESLARRLPYHYGDAEHRTVAQIIERLEAKGGREALMAMTLKDYFLGQRTFQSLEVLTAHPDVGKRSVLHYRMSTMLGKFYGANRYAIVGGAVMSGFDSTFRTARVMGRMSKAMVTETAPLVRSTARTTMEMLGGRVETLEAKGRTSPAAAWVAGQLQKHPSQVVVGAMYPVADKMGHLYKTLRNEATHDEMRYVLRQLYKKMGVRFDVGSEELASMGHVDMDILKRSGYTGSAALLAAEEEIRKVLSNSAMNSQDKLSALMRVAESHGAAIDHQMVNLTRRMEAIEATGQPEHVKMLLLTQALEEQNKVRMSMSTGGRVRDDAFVCHVGGESLRGNQVWETMVLRTMIWDGERGFLRGGIKEELVSARLNVANRLGSLDPTTAMEQLPEHMRNPTQLKAVAERNRQDLVSLFTEEGRKEYQAYAAANGKSGNITQASIADLVHFMQGGAMARTGKIDPKTGRMTWYASDMELGLQPNHTLVDVKRHWVSALNAKENFAIGQWVESRFTRSYSPAFNASIEAQLDRMPGASTWTVEQRGQAAKKLWVNEQLMTDMESRFNSHFGQNTYGTTRETTRFYAGVMTGFMEKALQEKGLEANHPDMVFLQKADTTNPKHLAKLSEMMKTYASEFKAVTSREMTYDDIAKSNKAVVMLHEGGYAYYKKGMMLSDYDRVMAGETALRDGKGQLRKFIPEEVAVNFSGRDDLMQQFHKVRSSKDPNEWQAFCDSTVKWAKEGGYSYEKEKVLAAVLWQYATTTHDYDRFWKESAVSVEAKRNVTPLAPNMLRFFGVEGNKYGDIIKPFRDIGMHGGDYISKVALASGGSLLKTSYDITPVSSQLRLHSFQLASQINSGAILKGLTEDEKTAYRAVAAQHGAYIQVWQYAIDRNPWRTSTSFGTHQAYGSFFQFGPAVPFSVKDNLRAYMSKGEYTNFMSFYGFPMDLAGKVMRPYVNMMRGMQMSMQGYASRWDSTGDSLRQWNSTEPRLLEAMQSLNPFSFKWFGGKNSERLAKLNGMGGSLERHQLAGNDYMTGLRQAPQDIFLQRKGVYASARTGDANPGETTYNYRMELQADAPMAEYLYRSKEAAYLYDKGVEKAAMDNTVRRTVSAEALAIRRDQEMRGFGVL